MCVLTLRGRPVAVARDSERLNEAMADYSAADQADMIIVADVEVLT